MLIGKQKTTDEKDPHSGGRRSTACRGNKPVLAQHKTTQKPPSHRDNKQSFGPLQIRPKRAASLKGARTHAQVRQGPPGTIAAVVDNGGGDGCDGYACIKARASKKSRVHWPKFSAALLARVRTPPNPKGRGQPARQRTTNRGGRLEKQAGNFSRLQRPCRHGPNIASVDAQSSN